MLLPRGLSGYSLDSMYYPNVVWRYSFVVRRLLPRGAGIDLQGSDGGQ